MKTLSASICIMCVISTLTLYSMQDAQSNTQLSSDEIICNFLRATTSSNRQKDFSLTTINLYENMLDDAIKKTCSESNQLNLDDKRAQLTLIEWLRTNFIKNTRKSLKNQNVKTIYKS